MRLPVLTWLFLGLVSTSLLAADPDPIDQARKLLNTGKYAESLDAFDALAKQEQAPADSTLR